MHKASYFILHDSASYLRWMVVVLWLAVLWHAERSQPTECAWCRAEYISRWLLSTKCPGPRDGKIISFLDSKFTCLSPIRSFQWLYVVHYPLSYPRGPGAMAVHPADGCWNACLTSRYPTNLPRLTGWSTLHIGHV